MSETTLVRIKTELADKYRNKHVELKGLTYTAVVEVMMRKALKENQP